MPMSLRKLSAELALNRPPGLLRDPLWWLAIVTGLGCAAAIWVVTGLSPGASVPRGLLYWSGVIIWQPLVEELLFRGLIQGMLLDRMQFRIRIAQLSFANFVTSLLFVGVHFVFHSPGWAIAVLFPSLVLGWLRERHASTWSAVITHMIFNLEFFGVAWLLAG